MYIRYNNKNYECKCTISKNSINYRNLPDDFPDIVSGQIVLCSNDGFEMRADSVEDYLRYILADGTLTLTNLPEPTVDDTGETVTVVSSMDILNTLLGVAK